MASGNHASQHLLLEGSLNKTTEYLKVQVQNEDKNEIAGFYAFQGHSRSIWKFDSSIPQFQIDVCTSVAKPLYHHHNQSLPQSRKLF